MSSNHFLGQCHQNEVKHDCFDHVPPLALALVMLTTLSLAPFNSLGQENQKEVQKGISGHVVP